MTKKSIAGTRSIKICVPSEKTADELAAVFAQAMFLDLILKGNLPFGTGSDVTFHRQRCVSGL